MLGKPLEMPAPNFNAGDARRIAETGFRIKVSTVRAFPHAAECDQLFRLITTGQAAYALRISNAAQDIAVLHFQNLALDHARAADPAMPVPRLVRSRAGEAIHLHQTSGQVHAVRLLTYLPGNPILGVMTTAALRRNIGKALARFDLAMRGFSHPTANPDMIWDIRNISRVAQLGIDFDDPALRRLVDRAFARFDHHVHPVLNTLRAQVIHNDLNPKNVLVDAVEPDRVSGIIDFGDMIHGPLVFDPAVAISKLLLDLVDMRQMRNVDPLAVACDVIGGYCAALPLDPIEIGLILDLCIVRLAMRVAIRVWRARANPREPLNPNVAASGAEILDYLLALDRAAVAARFSCAASGRNHAS